MNAFSITPAMASGGGDEHERERQKKEAEQERERAKQQQERQREAAKQQQERQREQAERERQRAQQERQRQQAQNAKNQPGASGTPPPAQTQKAQNHEQNHIKDEHGNRQEEQEEVEDGSDHPHAYHKHNSYDDDHPPRTLVELFDRLSQPSKNKKKKHDEHQDVLEKSLQPVAVETKPATSKRRRRGGGVVRPSALPPFARPDLLAVGLNRKKLRHARSLGFKVRATERFSSLDLTVTRLRPPEGLTPTQARILLKRELRSRTTVSLNKVYRVYHAATGASQNASTDGKNSATMKPSSRTPPRVLPKGADHFYGASVIHWKPKLKNCAQPVRVGVIDTSIDHNHRAFQGKRLSVGNFVPEGQPHSANWHGTGVLALLTGDAGSSTPGLIPDSSFYVANVFYADKQGFPLTDSISLLKALDWMDVLNVNVINMSVAGPKDELIKRAIARMSKKGVIFVAAGGNEGPAAPPSYPAAYPQVIAVTAVNKKLRGYRYANRGKYIDLAAPGVDIWTALPGQKQGFQSGTSFAVPYVTSIVAALYRETPTKTKNGFLKRLHVRDLGPKGRDPIYGRGLVVAPTTCRAGPPTLAQRSP